MDNKSTIFAALFIVFVIATMVYIIVGREINN
jgi:hypothetical protein